MKPLDGKAYGSIGHLPTSKLGDGDHMIDVSQASMMTEAVKQKGDTVIVEQKLDGSCVAVAMLDDRSIVAIGRAGHLAVSSPYEQHRRFAAYVTENHDRFVDLLAPGQRVVGEWLAQAHGTRYSVPHELFVPFDIMTGPDRMSRDRFWLECSKRKFTVPQVVSYGPPIGAGEAMSKLDQSFHGAIDPCEGVVYRYERKGRVLFLAKHVRHDFVPGRYFPETKDGPVVWNSIATDTSRQDRYLAALELMNKWTSENAGFDSMVAPMIEAELKDSSTRHFTDKESPR